jgi:hypothetical protein
MKISICQLDTNIADQFAKDPEKLSQIVLTLSDEITHIIVDEI